MTRYAIIAAFVLTGCRTQPIDAELHRLQSIADNITIIRDDFGVPHIFAETDAEAVFGLLYAQCEDDFPRVERNYTWAIGRLAEVEGKEAIYSDLRARMFMTKEEAIAEYEGSPKWLKELCQAFADGVNYYLLTHPQVSPKLLTRFEPWMPMYFSEGSIGGDIERVSTRKIRNFYEEEQPNESLGYQPDLFAEPAGSNGFAIAGEHTASGNAMLLINPHTSFYFRGEVHVVSKEGLNAYGAVTWGQFFIYQGFNEKTGWMHTSTYTDVIDEFIEEIRDNEGQLEYRYGDVWRPVQSLPVTLSFTEDGVLKTEEHTIYRTHHGPITHQIDGQWIATALMWEPAEALAQSYNRTKLSNHEEFREMMNQRTNSSNNTVFADAEGNIAYYHGNFIPERDERHNYQQPVAGSDPSTDWQGLHPVEECIVVVNPPNGWIQNCNSTPFTSAGAYSPKRGDYPKYMSIDRENFRGVHALRLLDEVDQLTLDGLIDMAYDPTLPAFEVLIPGLIEAANRESLSPGEKEAIGVLRSWDYTTSAESVAMSLAHFYGSQFLAEGASPQGLSFMDRITYFGTKSPAKERISVFRQTLDKLASDFGSWNIPWGEINRFQRISGEIDQKFDDQLPSLPCGLASGRWGALAAYGNRAPADTKKIYGSRGNSFVAVVEFGDRVKAKSLLAGGQSGDPNSPHFDDQAQPYVEANFKDVAFYREEIERRATKTYQPGK